jgi:hypothetical protein
MLLLEWSKHARELETATALALIYVSQSIFLKRQYQEIKNCFETFASESSVHSAYKL